MPWSANHSVYWCGIGNSFGSHKKFWYSGVLSRWSCDHGSSSQERPHNCTYVISSVECAIMTTKYGLQASELVMVCRGWRIWQAIFWSQWKFKSHREWSRQGSHCHLTTERQCAEIPNAPRISLMTHSTFNFELQPMYKWNDQLLERILYCSCPVVCTASCWRNYSYSNYLSE